MRGQADHRATCVVGNANHDGTPATVLEELFDGGAQAAAGPEAAESPTELGEVSNQDGSVEGAAERTSDESSRGMCWRRDRLIHRRNFGDRDATVIAI
jgi:hypothetical protein